MNIANAYINLRIGMIDDRLARLQRDYSVQDFLLNKEYSEAIVNEEICIEEKMNALRAKKSKLLGKIKK